MRSIPLHARWIIPCAIGLTAACADQNNSSEDADSVAFHTETLLPALNFDTGLRPEGSPVRLQLKASLEGRETVDAAAYATGSMSSPELRGQKGSGKVTMSGKFALQGRLVVDIPGLAQKYDGPIPGLDNTKIEFANETVFDPFFVGGTVTANAAIAEADLPPIPLPGGIPGTLKLHVSKGSSVSTTFAATCAAIWGDRASYTGTLTRSGNLLITPTIEIKVPVVGTKQYPMPVVTIPMPAPSQPVELTPSAVNFKSSAPSDGELAKVGQCNRDSNDAGADASTIIDAGSHTWPESGTWSEDSSTPDASTQQDSGQTSDTGSPPDGPSSDAGVSCTTVWSEAMPQSTLALIGDGPTSMAQTLTGSESAWYRVGLVETLPTQESFKVGVLLVPSYGGADFDLYVKHYASSTSLVPIAAYKSEVTGTTSGVAEKIEFVIPDTTPTDTPSLAVEVRAKSGSTCDSAHPWTLYIYAGGADHI